MHGDDWLQETHPSDVNLTTLSDVHQVTPGGCGLVWDLG